MAGLNRRARPGDCRVGLLGGGQRGRAGQRHQRRPGPGRAGPGLHRRALGHQGRRLPAPASRRRGSGWLWTAGPGQKRRCCARGSASLVGGARMRAPVSRGEVAAVKDSGTFSSLQPQGGRCAAALGCHPDPTVSRQPGLRSLVRLPAACPRQVGMSGTVSRLTLLLLFGTVATDRGTDRQRYFVHAPAQLAAGAELAVEDLRHDLARADRRAGAPPRAARAALCARRGSPAGAGPRTPGRRPAPGRRPRAGTRRSTGSTSSAAATGAGWCCREVRCWPASGRSTICCSGWACATSTPSRRCIRRRLTSSGRPQPLQVRARPAFARRSMHVHRDHPVELSAPKDADKAQMAALQRRWIDWNVKLRQTQVDGWDEEFVRQLRLRARLPPHRQPEPGQRPAGRPPGAGRRRSPRGEVADRPGHRSGAAPGAGAAPRGIARLPVQPQRVQRDRRGPDRRAPEHGGEPHRASTTPASSLFTINHGTAQPPDRQAPGALLRSVRVRPARAWA